MQQTMENYYSLAKSLISTHLLQQIREKLKAISTQHGKVDPQELVNFTLNGIVSKEAGIFWEGKCLILVESMEVGFYALVL